MLDSPGSFRRLRGSVRRLAMAGTLAIVAAMVSGCGVVLVGAEMASLQTTDKSLVDHAMSAVSQQDCSSVRAGNGGHYCISQADAAPPTPPPDPYCYRTLGQINCYEKPNPFGDGQQAIR